MGSSKERGFWIALKIAGTLCLLVTLPTMPATRHPANRERFRFAGMPAPASSAALRH
jgi:hypothetical protein